MKLLFAFTIFATPAVIFAQRFEGPSCPNCLGLAGPGSWIFWIIILAVSCFVAFKLFKSTQNNKKEHIRIKKEIQ